jgi:hypothetical protein
MGPECVSELRPIMGLFFIPQMIYEYGDSQWYYIDRWKLEKILSQCPFVCSKSHILYTMFLITHTTIYVYNNFIRRVLTILITSAIFSKKVSGTHRVTQNSVGEGRC